MSKIAWLPAISLGALFLAFGLRDPLAGATLSAAQRSAGFQSADIQVNGADCRFCRINVERTLKGVPGVVAAKADMGHHRARVVYDPKVVQPPAFESAVMGAKTLR